MQKTLFTTLHLLAVATMLLGSAYSQTQQTPPAKTPTTPAKSQPATAAKPHTAAAPKTGAASPLTTKKDKFSYALGMSFGKGLGAKLKEQSVEYDPNLVAQGMKDALAGSKTRLTDDEAHAVMSQVQAELQKEQQEKIKQAGETNKKEGEVFLAANKAKEGVVTLPSGLQYKILTPGTGPKPTAADTVVCNYRGTLIDGTEIDSSYNRKEPSIFPLKGVIKGWAEALQLMPVGSKWQVFVPSDLAYGERGFPGKSIGPNATLVFEVELISIEQKTQTVGAR